MRYNKHWNEDSKRAHAIASIKVKCKCGHSVSMPVYVGKQLCSWCGKYVFRDKKAEFKYRLSESIMKSNKGEDDKNTNIN